jgi:hypothetical protein
MWCKYGELENTYEILIGKLGRKILFGRPRHEQKHSGRTDCREQA